MTTYEEAEELTPAMVREYLERTGWTPSALYPGCLGKPGRGVIGLDLSLDNMVACIAFQVGCTEQSLLREINPRMRKGWPTDEAMAAHPGKWLMGFPDIETIIAWEPFIVRERRDQRAPHANVEHWPIDERGNKVPYPRAPGGG